MSTTAVLLRNETLKLRKRLAFWVTMGLFAFIKVVSHGEAYLDARNDPEKTFALPAAWSRIMSDESMVSVIFGAVVLILLVSTEFTWRTARQNVIDGLSKTEWFWGKAALLPIVGAIFIFSQILIGGGFALAGTDLAAARSAIVGGPFFQALGGFFLAFFVMGSLAFAVALAIRSSGPAMAAWFAWIGFGERLVVLGLGRLFEGLRPALGYLPFGTSLKLLDYDAFDPAAYQRAVEAAEAAGRAAPEPVAVGTAALVAFGWILLLAAISYLWFRKRDL
jgi:ABC-type transport system involved in multi-copper enzyme maturation permease subunit